MGKIPSTQCVNCLKTRKEHFQQLSGSSGKLNISEKSPMQKFISVANPSQEVANTQKNEPINAS
jgi:hypothetical protein